MFFASRLWRSAMPAAALACGATAAAASGSLPALSQPTVKTQSWDALFALPEQKQIAGKTALITGCSSGIGKATACGLASCGVNLVLVARRAEKVRAVFRARGTAPGQASSLGPPPIALRAADAARAARARAL